MRSLSEHFLSADAYAGLRYRCTTPPESSIRQCVPAHSPISTLRQTHAVACLVLLLYAQHKSMSMKFLKTFFIKNVSQLGTEYGGDYYSGYSRTKRPPERQATETSSCIHCAAADGTEICKRVGRQREAARPLRQRGTHGDRTGRNSRPRNRP